VRATGQSVISTLSTKVPPPKAVRLTNEIDTADTTLADAAILPPVKAINACIPVFVNLFSFITAVDSL
jgi:hypothetical protein